MVVKLTLYSFISRTERAATLFLTLVEYILLVHVELKLESNEKMMLNIVLIQGYVSEATRKVPEYLQLYMRIHSEPWAEKILTQNQIRTWAASYGEMLFLIFFCFVLNS